jgi:hypothetical protein
MIMRRFVIALRQQDWTTVFVEFLIVVAGIFVGLQVDDWNENRQHRAREQETLVALFKESLETIAYLDDEIAAWEASNRLRDNAVKALSNWQDDDEGTDEIVSGIAILWNFGSLSPPSAVYTALKDAGNLALITDATVLESLSRYHAKLDDFAVAYTRKTDFSYRNYPFLWDGFSSAYDDEAPDRRRKLADAAKLARNPSFMNAAIDLNRQNTVIQMDRREVRAEALVMCRALGEAVGQPCASE